MVSVFNTFPVGGAISGAVSIVTTRSTTAAAETTNEIIWITQASGY